MSDKIQNQSSLASRATWNEALAELEELYKRIENKSLSLPRFSFNPLLILLKHSILFIFYLLINLILIILIFIMNLVILIRNIFPGQWPYRSFFLIKYCKLLWTWLYRGEPLFYPILPFRFLIRLLVHTHFYFRFRSIKEQLYVDYLNGSLTNEARIALEKKIENLPAKWHSLFKVIVNYIVPFLSLFLSLLTFIFKTLGGLILVIVLLLSIVILFSISSFIVKRSLMLAPKSDSNLTPDDNSTPDRSSIYFPGNFSGNNSSYREEKRILNKMNITVKEFPFDILYLLVILLLNLMLYNFIDAVVTFLICFCLTLFFLYRRRETNRR